MNGTRLGALALFLSAGFCPASMGHEIATHDRLGDAAVAYLAAAYATPGAGSARPLLLNSVAALQQALRTGAEREDDGFVANTVLGVANPYGRFVFHFTPALSSTIQLPGGAYTLSANGCSSIGWGLGGASGPNGAAGCSIACSIPWDHSGFCQSIAGVTHTNSFRWEQDLVADGSGAPAAGSIAGIGYVIHLLEDLGSPAHSRNDPHPCAMAVACDPFEKSNDNQAYAPFGDPQSLPGDVWRNFLAATIAAPGVIKQVIPTAAFTTPAGFFNALQALVSANYYSDSSVFQGPGPASLFSAGEYFYGACLTSPSGVAVSEIAGTCRQVVNPSDGRSYAVRKIAHKGPLYFASCRNPVTAALSISMEQGCDPKKAGIDQTIAREQFAELGPVISQHVAAFLQFYAPALSVRIQGTASGSVASTPGAGIDCRSGVCAALFVQGSPVTLKAASPQFTGWGGDCASGGTNPTVAIILTKDMTCAATFGGVGLAGR